MKVMLIQAKVRPEKVSEVEAQAKRVFSAIDSAKPEGVWYASCKLSDSVSFVILLGFEGEDNPLMKLPEFNEFQESLKTVLSAPPMQEPLQIVGSYRLFE